MNQTLHKVGWKHPQQAEPWLRDLEVAEMLEVDIGELRRVVVRNLHRMPRGSVLEVDLGELSAARMGANAIPRADAAPQGRMVGGDPPDRHLVFTEEGLLRITSILTAERAARTQVRCIAMILGLRLEGRADSMLSQTA